ncbi:transcriptional regulator with XRE-family HTH domain [Lipingzhangella halophila]|uniref:Transcriptional regulator with XRE-family HTH domain n=1 Tax=Lipingzhangella halophila TaxID=1783352 RepID=A0A7W7W298_9ACTN|nr:helix-turn-helix transcriptional regulator [Lipingzhangella halophila]MBB4931782.1 transcriptional regulator with XRE-family HTH domain [Lipingzhangella halophila]
MSQRFNRERARQRRYELGLTVDQLAARIGAPKSYISQVETGAFSPGPVRFLALAGALQVAPAELWVDTEEREATA